MDQHLSWGPNLQASIRQLEARLDVLEGRGPANPDFKGRTLVDARLESLRVPLGQVDAGIRRDPATGEWQHSDDGVNWHDMLALEEVDRLTAQNGSNSQVILTEDPALVRQLLYGTPGTGYDLELRPDSGVLRFSGGTNPATDYWTAEQAAGGGVTLDARGPNMSGATGANNPAWCLQAGGVTVADFGRELDVGGFIGTGFRSFDNAGNAINHFGAIPNFLGTGVEFSFCILASPPGGGNIFTIPDSVGSNLFSAFHLPPGLFPGFPGENTVNIGADNAAIAGPAPMFRLFDNVGGGGSNAPSWNWQYDTTNKFLCGWGLQNTPGFGTIPGLVLGSDTAVSSHGLSSNDVLIAPDSSAVGGDLEVDGNMYADMDFVHSAAGLFGTFGVGPVARQVMAGIGAPTVVGPAGGGYTVNEQTMLNALTTDVGTLFTAVNTIITNLQNYGLF